MQSFFSRAGRVVVWGLAGLAVNECGGGGGARTPSAPSTPAATPTPAPTPQPPVSATCARLPPGDPRARCGTEAPYFQDALYAVIDELQAARPDIVEGNQVHNTGLYYVEIVKALDRRGICAVTDGEEIGLADDHSVSEVYDILSARNQVRRYYVGSCRPSLIPDPEPAPFPVPPGCPLPASRLVACGDPGGGAYYEDVAAAIERLLRERPDMFDFDDRSPGTGWPRARDPLAYQNAVIAILAAQGYCAVFDGEEITVKRTNDFTEHYDVNYADVYIRQGLGIYRGSCYPAAF